MLWPALVSTPADLPAASQAQGALFTARWALLLALLFITLVQTALPELFGAQLGGPWSAIGLVVAGAAVNLAVARRGRAWSPRRAGAHLLLDVAGLTCFLAISGAAAHPFTMLYFVPIGLGTLLPRGFTWLVALAAIAGFALLLGITAWSTSLGGHFLHHLGGMWLGMAISGAIITLFVHRIAAALAGQRAELERARRAALEARHLASLGGLAAGAAHELGTPLGTIQLLSDELEQMPTGERARALQSIRREVRRCKEIIHQMANPELSAEQLVHAAAWPLGALEAELRQTRGGAGAEVDFAVELSSGAERTTTQPRLVIERVVHELVTNALFACRNTADPHVRVELGVVDDSARVSVTDNGPGLDAAAKAAAFEAFFSTKAKGRGLGLYLARAHLQQLGGSISIDDVIPTGARFIVSFPLEAPGLSPGALS
jgi:two-component system, sensor histidine kinase RegB